jgi:pimeloyl-ACP methyl ester carboxylesterase
MEQKFILVKGIKIHYRSMGKGEPIVLLHASPRSGKMLENFGKMLSEHFKVIIPDLPGYGFSEAIPERVETLYDVVPYLKAFFTKLNFKNPIIYGTATGAQLGIAYAITYPLEVKKLFLDNPAHFSEEEYQQISEKYFVDLTPKQDGSHLQNLWNHVRESMMYFPWYDHSPENQFSYTEPSPLIIADTVKEYLVAGVRFDELYKAAFLHEKVEKIQHLKIPTVIFKWKTSILLKYIDRLLSFQLPDNIKVVETEKDILERYKKMVEVINMLPAT